MDRIKVTAHLVAPIVTGGGYMTLDGFLAALLFDELHPEPNATPQSAVRR